MLHARLRTRQVHGRLPAALLATLVALLACGAAGASRSDDLAAAEQLSRSGRHAEAGAMYAELADRPFFGPDARLSLLAAREYLAAGRLEDATRLAAQASRRARGDDAVLLGRVQAEIALARNDPAAAVAALDAIPRPWPAPLAAELLQLRGRAEFAAGRPLEGIRAFEERARLVGSVDAREETYRMLVDELLARPGTTAVPPGATESERAWLELAQMLGSPPSDPAAMSRRAADWQQRHPHHPGSQFLPAAPPTGPIALPGTTPALVALLLPLSGRQQAFGVAVRDGFLAACLSAPAGAPRVLVYDTAALPPPAAYRQALADGAQFVVGPLLKDEVTALVSAQQLPVPTLVLNSYSGTAPPFLLQYALDPESEARAAARRIAADGLVRGVALFPRSAWGERLYAAFTEELQATGVTLSSTQFYDPGDRDFSGPLRAALGRFGGAGDRKDGQPAPRRDPVAEARDGPQFAFIAATAQAARAIKPQLRFQMTYDMPVYATSDAIDPSSRAIADLEGLTYPEMPWILSGGGGTPGLWDVLHDEWTTEGRGRLRLYAFGFDAFQLMRQLRSGSPGVSLDGLTGGLDLGADGRVQRRLDWARVQGGQPQAAGPAVPPAPAGEP